MTARMNFSGFGTALASVVVACLMASASVAATYVEPPVLKIDEIGRAHV